MRPILLSVFIAALLCLHVNLFGQEGIPAGKVKTVQRPYYIPPPSSRIVNSDSLKAGKDSANGYLLPHTRQSGKKGYTSFVLADETAPVNRKSKQQPAAATPLFAIHGNILYNVDYRSYVDTPYAESDVYYHTIQTYLDVTYKNAYPVRVYLTNRFGNSAYTRRFSDVNMQYNTHDFRNRIRQRILSYQGASPLSDSLQYWQQSIEAKRLQLHHLKGEMNDPFALQKEVEAKEQVLFGRIRDSIKRADTMRSPGIPGWALQKPGASGEKVPDYLQDWINARRNNKNTDSLLPKAATDTSFMARQEATKKRIDSLQQELLVLENRYRSCKERWNALQQRRNGQVNESLSVADLEKQVRDNNIPDSALPDGYKTLWAVKSLGLGRTMIDYSELSAKNISITGVQLEYNPSYYLAIAAGTIDYRFRDFIVKNAAAPGQHLWVLRGGVGQKESNNIIATWYTGKKQLYNSTGTTSAIQPDYHLMGFTIEGNYRVNNTTLLTAEVAKSSLPYYNRPGNNKSLLATAVSLKDHSNEAYSLKVQSLIPATETRLTGFYKQYGANFQSFSFISTGVQQKAWMLKADQPFFRRRLMVSASVKENDYTNPAATVGYQSNMVFKSLMATLRIPRWPVVSLGYYPSSQLTKLSDREFTENMFYSMVGNVSYAYNLDGVNMNSAAMYTRFYNKQADSAFVYFNTTNLLLNQVLYYHRFTSQTALTMAFAAEYNLYTWQQDCQYAILKWLTAGAGIKYNKQTHFNIQQWGYSANATVKIKRLGEIQLLADKAFIPGAGKQLVPNNTGRFSFFRIF